MPSKSTISNPPHKNDRPDVEEGLADPPPQSSTATVSPSLSHGVIHPSLLATYSPPAPAEAAAEQRFGPPPPTGTIEEAMSDADGGGIAPAVAGWGNFEQVDDDDDAPPAPFNSAEFEEGNAEKWAAASRARAHVESVKDDDEAPPAPFNSAEYEEGNGEMWAAASRARAQIKSVNNDDEAPPRAIQFGGV